MTTFYAGPYGHDYYYFNGILVAQPSLADGTFTVNEMSNVAVEDFEEPLTDSEKEEVIKALGK